MDGTPSELLDPFRTSLPRTYWRVPSWVADTVALRSDWCVCGMDYWHVARTLYRPENERQESLFDPSDFKS